MPNDIRTADTRPPKYPKGYEVFFFDEKSNSIRYGIIKSAVKNHVSKLKFTCLQNWIHKGNAYKVYVPDESTQKMKLILMPEYKLFSSYKECMENQITFFKYDIEENTRKWEDKIKTFYHTFVAYGEI